MSWRDKIARLLMGKADHPPATMSSWPPELGAIDPAASRVVPQAQYGVDWGVPPANMNRPSEVLPLPEGRPFRPESDQSPLGQMLVFPGIRIERGPR